MGVVSGQEVEIVYNGSVRIYAKPRKEADYGGETG